ncbi:hypothetical protein MDAP_000073 [Mitosporidium daphniae]|uniref:Homeobox domain-containing protein n=1 Tax=Mitosporidium daphniae TaxID=1485682 RepID=A0A098VUI8_9MICR|nr:uncharacterized protein DI09_14p30 [Mitosporidium daphniae]KGG52620.1 hypothetical protein DI09_14p30 [Mitosporidium daphniae]|eukprot:XP_013239082.1 uncharacterized protein DI09_14p30 [Mitosporidium daphniae]
MSAETNFLAEQIVKSPDASIFQPSLESSGQVGVFNAKVSGQHEESRFDSLSKCGYPSGDYLSRPKTGSIIRSPKEAGYDVGADSINISSFTTSDAPSMEEPNEASHFDDASSDLSGDLAEGDFPDFSVPKRPCSSLDSSPADSESKISLDEGSPSLSISRSTHGSPSRSRRRSRTVMTPSQTRILLAVLDETYFPTNEQREQLSKILQIPQRTIQVWFQNQRQKAKQFGKVTGSPSTSASHSPSSPSPSLIRPSGFHSGVPITPYHHSTASHVNAFSNGQRPILLYGRSPIAPTEQLFYSNEYSVKFPISSEAPIRKRTLPVQSSSGSWDTLSWKYNAPNSNNSIDHQTRRSPFDSYKGYRSASLPISSGYPNNQSVYYSSERKPNPNSVKTEPDVSPNISLSNLLQSTSLMKKDGQECREHSRSDSQTRPPEEFQTKVLEKFKEEEDQLELPSLLLALRG